jgi:hypothetical protein
LDSRPTGQKVISGGLENPEVQECVTEAARQLYEAEFFCGVEPRHTSSGDHVLAPIAGVSLDEGVMRGRLCSPTPFAHWIDASGVLVELVGDGLQCGTAVRGPRFFSKATASCGLLAAGIGGLLPRPSLCHLMQTTGRPARALAIKAA